VATPRALILTAPFGSGHERVAAALADAFRAEGALAEVQDHFRRFVSPLFVRASLAMFWTTLRWAPRLWGLAYELSARMDPRSPTMGGMDRVGARALGDHLEATRPDVVVAVHPTPAGALGWLKRTGALRAPHGIVLTDFVAHRQWLYPGLDRYFVPSDEIRSEVVRRGIPAERVVPSGIPIAPAFALPPDRLGARRAIGLPPDHPAVLVTGGMRGTLGGIAEVSEVLAGLTVSFGALVVCGDHRELEARLRARFGADPRFRVLGRVEDMEQLMAAADLVVTKAGAVTCSEAMALGRPLVFYRSLPGQERTNEVTLERAGAGVRAPDRAALTRILRRALGEPEWRASLAAAARRLGRAEAGRTIAKEMLALGGGR
jgi:processive 1,2-diacylglycerol beta-glucosyltransferase